MNLYSIIPTILIKQASEETLLDKLLPSAPLTETPKINQPTPKDEHSLLSKSLYALGGTLGGGIAGIRVGDSFNDKQNKAFDRARDRYSRFSKKYEDMINEPYTSTGNWSRRADLEEAIHASPPMRKLERLRSKNMKLGAALSAVINKRVNTGLRIGALLGLGTGVAAPSLIEKFKEKDNTIKQASDGLVKVAQAKWRIPENLNKLIKVLDIGHNFSAPALTNVDAKHAIGVALKDKNADIFIHDKHDTMANKFFESIPGNTIKTSLKNTPANSKFLFRGIKVTENGDIPIYGGKHTGESFTFGSPHFRTASSYIRKGFHNSSMPGLVGVYEKHPLQTYVPDFGIEKILSNKRIPNVKFTDTPERINLDPEHIIAGKASQITLTKDPRIGSLKTYETPIVREKNPFKALLLQKGNDRDLVKLIDTSDKKTINKLLNFYRENSKYLKYSERAEGGFNSVDWTANNRRLRALKDTQPDKFEELVKRRVNKIFFKEDPNRPIHISGLEKILTDLK